jgi:phage tail-like protein
MARSSKTEPLEKFRFQVTFSTSGDGNTTDISSGWHDVQLPKRSTTKVTYREGDDNDINQLSPGLSSMEDVVLSRGLIPKNSTDSHSVLYAWAAATHKHSAGNTTRSTQATNPDASHSFRKDVTITMLDREGQAARKWTLYQAWPVNFVPGSDLNAGEDGEKSMEQLTLAYEDFQEENLASAETT